MKIYRNTYISIIVTFINDIDLYLTDDKIIIGVANDFSRRVVANAEILSDKNRIVNNNTFITTTSIIKNNMSKINKDIDQFTGQCNKTPVPKILIEGQTFGNGSDIANMHFTIIDKLEYYKDTSIIGTKCGYFYTKINKLKETTFLKCCENVSLFNVLRGEGKNALEKAEFLFLKSDEAIQKIGFINFYYNNLIPYAMIRYILSKILYGNFNINYLLNK